MQPRYANLQVKWGPGGNSFFVAPGVFAPLSTRESGLWGGVARECPGGLCAWVDDPSTRESGLWGGVARECPGGLRAWVDDPSTRESGLWGDAARECPGGLRARVDDPSMRESGFLCLPCGRLFQFPRDKMGH